MAIPNWDFLGTTMVTSNYIRLTPDEQSRQGALWNSAVSLIITCPYICKVVKMWETLKLQTVKHSKKAHEMFHFIVDCRGIVFTTIDYLHFVFFSYYIGFKANIPC